VHDWWDWYAAYLDARQTGSTPDAASEAAGRYMQDALGIDSQGPAVARRSTSTPC
jgi:hypothetical protein